MNEALQYDPGFDLVREMAVAGSSEGKVKKLEQIRSKEEVRRVKRKILQMAGVWAERGGLRVLPGDWWKCGFADNSEVIKVVEEYLAGKRAALDDLPDEFFRPDHIFYPEA